MTIAEREAAEKLRRDTLLRLAPRVQLTISGDRLLIEGPHDAVQCDASLLPLLDRFRHPLTLGDALTSVQAGVAHDWMAIAAQLVDLAGAGVLVAGDAAAAHGSDHGFGYMEPHIAMLADEQRTMRYVDAIRRVVQRDDIVLDLGTGTGILAVAAAQAGARRVYAIERTAIADVAAEMFARNGVADRVTLIRDVSTRVTLPERATVMTSEILGTEPLSERMLEYTRDAVDRLLVPGGRMIPRRLRIFAHAVSVPDSVVAQHFVTHETTAQWKRTYGIDCSAVGNVMPALPPWLTVRTQHAASWPALSPRVPLLDIDLADPPRPPIRGSAVTAATCDGRLDGVVVYWEIELDDRSQLSTEPAASDESCSWGTAVWLAVDRPFVERGRPLRIEFLYSAPRGLATVSSS